MNGGSLIVVAGVLCLTGCTMEKPGPLQSDFRVIERDDSEALRVSLNMGAGELRVGSGTQKMLRADFAYNQASWKPTVHYSSAAKVGTLRIEQPSGVKTLGNSRYEWDLRLTRDLPVDLDVNFGAGEATLDLGSLDMRSVEINMGVGELKLDLRGQPKRDCTVKIHGGVGEATVRLPADVGILAEAHGGIGEVSARGLRKEDGRYRNDAYGHAKNTIRLEIHGGVGSVKLISE
jgi:hypothetical protein